MAAKEVAHDVATKAARKAPGEVAAAAKHGAAKTKAAVKGGKTDKRDIARHTRRISRQDNKPAQRGPEAPVIAVALSLGDA